MWTFVLVVFGVAVSAQYCRGVPVHQTYMVHEGGTVVVECLILPSSAHRSSPVYWYSSTRKTYLTEDYEVTLKTNLTVNLINRLSVIGGDGSSYNLQITNVTTEDAGNYSCGYYTRDYTPTDEWELISTNSIIIHEPIPPDSSYPLCATDPSDQLHPGQTVRLVCISRGGIPPATLTWYREGVPLKTSLSDTQFEGYYERTLLEVDNGVEFVCKATSPGFDAPKSCSVTPLRLVPYVRIYASHDPVTVGQEKVQFNCLGEGIPAISSYFWYWNGQLITGLNQDPDRVIEGDNGQILTLMSPQLSENNVLVLCVIETSTRLRNTDHIRLVVQGSNSSGVTGNPGWTLKPSPQHNKNNRSSSLTTGAIFGWIFAGIVIAIIIFAIIKGTLLFRNRHHGNMEFNKISLSDLNNYRRPCGSTAEETARLNQTNNKTCNLGVIDLVNSNDSDYDRIQDNDSRHTSLHSDNKHIEQIYANPNNSMSANVDEERCLAEKCPSKNLCGDKVNHGNDRRLSDYDLPKGASSHVYFSPKRVRSHTVVAKANQYQRPTRHAMPKIQEDSNSASLHKTNLAISLPDLSPLSTSRTMLVPIDLDISQHDYVNMDVISDVTSPDHATCDSDESPDYVNYRRRRRRNRDTTRSDSSSSGYCEEPDSPNIVLLSPTHKPMSYAELDFTASMENIVDKSLDEGQETCPIPGPATCDLTSYARIAYVFKDRRQQSEP